MNIGVTNSNMPNRYNAYDLDPTYRNAFGQPLLRLTYNFTDNASRDWTVCRSEGGRNRAPAERDQCEWTGCTGDRRLFDRHQSTHNTGGALMGASPRDSVVNRYLQSWDVSNVFVIGASAFPHNSRTNPTGPVGALAYWATDAIKTKYRQRPGPLV